MRKRKEFNGFAPLEHYYKVFGNLDIKKNEVYEYDGEDVNIGDLVSNIRRKYKAGKLTDDEIEYLELMGMNWNGKDHFKSIKENLLLYYNTYGTMDGLTSYSVVKIGRGKDKKVIDVGNSLNQLRVLYRAGELSVAEELFVKNLGVDLSPRDTETVYGALIDYAKKNGSISDIKMGDVYEYNDKTVNIGRQINHLRTRANKGELDDDEIAYWDGLGMVWDGREKMRKSSKIEVNDEMEK
ncbi:MAG: hypothetical protein E7361_00375 [Clostridiales bacterium]|nr:hypothetical protein [Clostridiales bacterium]